MGKLVVIKLDGDFQHQEVRVMLEIGLEGDRPWIELPGKLPRSPELSTQLYDWVEKYRNIGEPSRRIKTKKIIYDGGIEKRIEECCEAAKALNDRFNDWLESPQFRDCDRRLREELSREDEIRVLIRTEDRQLQKLPWHLWGFFDRYIKAELALSPPSVQGLNSLKVSKQKVKILAILGHDEGIKTEVDRQILENLPHAEVKFLVKPPYREINDCLWEQNWDILFFAGHSESENERGVIYINERDKLSIAELKYGLRKAVNRGLQLAIFNSCDGLGLARELAELHIPQTIIMREPVPDRVAHGFLKDFLQAFSHGKPFYLAVREARERLQGLEKEFPCATWLPIICQNPAVKKPPLWADLIAPRSPLQQWQSGLKTAFIISLVSACLTLGFNAIGAFQHWELQSFDRLVRWRPDEGPDRRLLIVKITDDSVREFQEYPLTDTMVLQLLQKFDAYQPRAIGLNLFRDIPHEPGHAELNEYLKQSDRIIAVCDIGLDDPPQRTPPPPGAPKERLGFTDLAVDPDRVIRRHILGMEAATSCPTPYSLSLQLARAYLRQEGIDTEIKRLGDNEIKIGNTLFKRLDGNAGAYQLPWREAKGYQILINYRSTAKIAQEVKLTDVLKGSLDPELPDLVNDRIVLIGTEVRSATNFHLTPYSGSQTPLQEISGGIVQAHLVSQILSAILDGRSLLWWWPQWVEALWIWGWSAIGALLAWRVKSPWLFAIAQLVSLCILGGFCFILVLAAGWVPLIASAFALIATSAIVRLYRERSLFL